MTVVALYAFLCLVIFRAAFLTAFGIGYVLNLFILFNRARVINETLINEVFRHVRNILLVASRGQSKRCLTFFVYRFSCNIRVF